MRRRVKITGIGPVTPAGIGRAAFFDGINEPVSRIRVLDFSDIAPDRYAGPFIGATVEGFDLLDYAPDDYPNRLALHTQFGYVGALLALEDAGVSIAEFGDSNPIVVTGTSVMDVDKISRGIMAVLKRGSRVAPSSIIYETSVVNVAAKIADLVTGNCRQITLQTSCCSGLDAVGRAYELISGGETNLVVAGGAESPLSYFPMLAFNASEFSPATEDEPQKSCRPFDLWRSTGSIGEGACIFVLESEDSPRPALAWISGFAIANDTDLRPGSGLCDAMKGALLCARRQPSSVGYVNAWGPGHREIDRNEADGLASVFGRGLDRVAVTSIKGAIGTPLAASGPIQLASTVLSLNSGLVPPTVNWEQPDPGCPLNLSNRPRRLSFDVALVNSHGLSGSNSCLVVERQ